MCATKEKTNIVPVAIIGGGPAGLSAGVYTSRAQLRTIIFAGAEPGGELTGVKLIENWPGRSGSTGAKVIDDLTAQAKHFGAIIINQTIKSVDLNQWPFVLTTEEGTTLHAFAVIVASGGIARRLQIPGVEKYWGKGVGSCTICEAPFYKDKDAAVIGGGDTSGERALQLAAYAKNVYLIVREPRIQACATVQDYLKKAKNIHILLNTRLEEIRGNDEIVTSMILKEGKNAPREVPINGLYFAIGYIPNSDLIKKYVSIDKQGFVMVEPQSQRTTIQGVFAAGNVACSDKEYGKAGVATGSGVKAGMDAITFLEKIGFTNGEAEKMSSRFYKPVMPENADEKVENPKNAFLDYYGIDAVQS
jgi:thioredoxin reductase (NADPH)